MHIAAKICGVLVLAASSALASAQSYPGRPIRVIVPTGSGTSTSTIAHMIADKMPERLGQAVVVENRPGASQMIGAEHVAKSPADGHTIMLTSASFTGSAAIQTRLPLDPVNDLTGVTMVCRGPFLLVVHPSLPVKSLKDLLALARARPGQLNYGSAGPGSIVHLMGEVLAENAKINIVHVPYKSFAQAVTDVVGGHLQILMGSLPNVWGHVKNNRLRALAVTSAKRSGFVPEYPTVAEGGVPGYEAGQWWGMLAPAKTPGEILTRLNSEVQRILATEEVKSRFAAEGAEPVLGITPDVFSATLKAEVAKWRKVVRDRNITAG